MLRSFALKPASTAERRCHENSNSRVTQYFYFQNGCPSLRRRPFEFLAGSPLEAPPAPPERSAISRRRYATVTAFSVQVLFVVAIIVIIVVSFAIFVLLGKIYRCVVVVVVVEKGARAHGRTDERGELARRSTHRHARTHTLAAIVRTRLESDTTVHRSAYSHPRPPRESELRGSGTRQRASSSHSFGSLSRRNLITSDGSFICLFLFFFSNFNLFFQFWFCRLYLGRCHDFVH